MPALEVPGHAQLGEDSCGRASGQALPLAACGAVAAVEEAIGRSLPATCILHGTWMAPVHRSMTWVRRWGASAAALARVDRSSFALLVGVRCSVGVLIPLLAGVASGHTDDGVSAAVGALVVGFVSFEGRHRTTISAMLLGALAVTGSVFAGAVVGAHDALLLVAMALWGLVAGLAGTWSTGVSVAALQAVVALVVFSAIPMSVPGAAVQAAWVMAGSLVQVVLLVATWPWRGVGGERHAVAEVFRRLADYARSTPDAPPAADQLTVGAEALADPNPMGSPAALQILNELLGCAEAVRVALGAVVLRHHGSSDLGAGASSGAMSAGDDRSVRSAMSPDATIPGDPDVAAVRLPSASTTMGGVELAAVASRLLAVADLLDGGTRSRLLGRGARAAPAGEAPDEQAPAARRWGGTGAPADVSTHLAMLLDEAGSLAAALPERGMGLPHRTRSSTWADRRARAAAWGARVRHMVADRGSIRHAVRLAGVLVLGTLLARGLDLRDGYWVPMTAAVVVRGDFTGTLQRGLGRLAGTLAGAGLVTALAAVVVPGRTVLVVAVVVLGWGTYATFRANYGLYSVFLTSTVVALLALVGEPIVSTARDRAVATALGGALALVVYVAWPTWKYRLLPGFLASMLASQGRYAAGVVEALDTMASGGQPDLGRLDALAAEARGWRIRVGALLPEVRIEPGRRGELVAAATALTGQLNRCAHLAISLHADVAVAAAQQPAPYAATGDGGSSFLRACSAWIGSFAAAQASILEGHSAGLADFDPRAFDGRAFDVPGDPRCSVEPSAAGRASDVDVPRVDVPRVVSLVQAYRDLVPLVEDLATLRGAAPVAVPGALDVAASGQRGGISGASAEPGAGPSPG